jgi:hypothetical protein
MTPSMISSVPTTNEASSEARYKTAFDFVGHAETLERNLLLNGRRHFAQLLRGCAQTSVMRPCDCTRADDVDAHTIGKQLRGQGP